jgi:Uma2 family endonuclease
LAELSDMATILEPKLLTAEEYGRLPDDGRVTELVRGRIVELNRPFSSHGYLMTRIAALLWRFVDQKGVGRVVSGDAGVVAQRDPDTVRGPDVAFYSYERIPHGSRPDGYWPASPELVIEIRSNDDRWKEIHQKVGEYLSVDVLTVAVVDPESQRVHLFSADRETVVLNSNDQLTFPGVLPGFEIVVGRLFD